MCSSEWVKKDIITGLDNHRSHSPSPQISLEQAPGQRQGVPCLPPSRLSHLHAGTSIARAPRCCPSREWPVPCIKQRQPLQAAEAAHACQTVDAGENSGSPLCATVQAGARYHPSDSPPTPSRECETSAVAIPLPCLEHLYHQIPSAFIQHCEL